MKLYQIRKRGIEHNHAHSQMYNIPGEIYMNITNAKQRIKELSKGVLGSTFKEVVDYKLIIDERHGEMYEDILDFVHYEIDLCYDIIEVIPKDCNKDKLPF